MKYVVHIRDAETQETVGYIGEKGRVYQSAEYAIRFNYKSEAQKLAEMMDRFVPHCHHMAMDEDIAMWS